MTVQHRQPGEGGLYPERFDATDAPPMPAIWGIDPEIINGYDLPQLRAHVANQEIRLQRIHDTLVRMSMGQLSLDEVMQILNDPLPRRPVGDYGPETD